MVTSGFFVLVNLSGAAVVLLTRDLSERTVVCTLIPVGCCLLLSDWFTFGILDMWTLVVLVMDGLLAFGAPSCAARLMLGLTVAYLVFRSVQEGYDYGFWVWDGMQGSDRYADYRCPQKERSLALSALVFRVFAFTVDYVITRGFAHAMQTQVAVIKSSEHVAQHVADLLAHYATEEARHVVEREGGSLADPLLESFNLLLANLDSYRVYLPDSILHPDARGGERDAQELRMREVAPPGESGDCTVCFTDIEASTELWEAHPQGMYEGLQRHNQVLRSLAASMGGYEVKTIGDAFMLTFNSPIDACRFGMDVQLVLLRQHWPTDLCSHHLCSYLGQTPSGGPLWHGLRVRIGVHCGPVRREVNPITGRVDYFGPTVNTAARVESAVKRGGLVGVTDSVLEAMGAAWMEQLGNPVVTDLGVRELRGVHEPVRIHILLLQDLAARTRAPLSPAPSAGTNVRVRPAEQALASPPCLPDLGNSVLVLESVAAVEPGRSHSSVFQGAERPAELACSGSGIGMRRARSAISPRSPGGTLPRDVLGLFTGESPSWSTRAMSLSGRSVTPRLSTNTPIMAVPNLALGLRHSTATCAVVRAALDGEHQLTDRLRLFVAAVESAADSSQGVFTCVLSACCVVTWNAAVPCAVHTVSCSMLLKAVVREATGRLPCHVGVASGGVLSGNLAAGRRHFATVVGGCVELASALAAEAELCGDAALLTGEVVDICARRMSASRAQLWCPAGARPFVVWEVSVSGVQRAVDAGEGKWDGLLAEEEEAVTGWADSDVALFHRAAEASCTPGGAQKVLLEFCRREDLDGELSARYTPLLRRADQGTLCKHNVAPVWEPQEEP
eukprot:TRINITY_DN7469_c0_g1_i1.p1 TRINITY_DN7469_c0_g1~~TRINITY_DN7469_c0_g1_i1.p1  ORF type:complete len:929 (+),score=124.93 TRINITY_DN7469_c0_g1_i1:257-2788(+)